jgi:hypothetical protein
MSSNEVRNANDGSILENALTLKVFDVAGIDQLSAICRGEHIGTLVES